MKFFKTSTIVILLLLLKIKISTSETLKLELNERKFGKSEVLVELIFPNKKSNIFPLIISQHGSTLDAKIDGSSVRTDEHTKRLLKKAIENGFAVAIVDAFYTHDIKPNQKHRQPWAADYATGIAKFLSEDKRLDPNNFFFSGFSYGGHHAHFLYEKLNFTDKYSWAGIIAAEPPCNAFFQAKKYKTPVLTIKGGESHYKPQPCEILTKLYKDMGTKAEIKIFPKSNHFFSHNGRITKGIAFNGCNENPIIMKSFENWTFLNGEKANRKIAIKKCMTKTSGSGKTREDLDFAIDETINFVKQNLR